MPRRRQKRLSTVHFAELLLVCLILFLLGGRLVGGGGESPLLTASELTLRIDLNEAEWHDLVCLPGIGEIRAKEIVRDRRERGPFSGPDDLDRVKGIGPVTIRNVRKHLR